MTFIHYTKESWEKRGRRNDFFICSIVPKFNILFIRSVHKHEYTMSQSMKRPFGITIIAILAIVSGVVLIFGGLSSLVSGAFFASISVENVLTEIQQQDQQPQTLDVAELHALVQLLGSSSIVMGAIVLVIGLGYLVVAYSLLKGRKWARTITVI